MSNGIKLYQHFVDQLNKIGRPRRAWFTTFNLDIHFFEKYMLSALMGVSFKELRNAYDYEALNTQLAYDEQVLGNDDKMEVRVFYDYRALQQGNMPKQTSVHLHPIDIKQVSGLNPDLYFTEGVFHPKVILIETVNSEYWLMVSSANLSFGGWANNRESFFCDQIRDLTNARSVGEFFKGIISGVKKFGDSPLLHKLLKGQFQLKETSWYFFSSFEKYRFLDQLSPTENTCPLQVWSPYFAEELPNLIEEARETQYFDDITIIPAKSELQKIRLTEISYSECIKQGVKFKQDKIIIDGFTHAKVWLTPTALAIGSWNMTRAGMNISINRNNNIEAGVIYGINKNKYSIILEDNPTTSLRNPKYYEEQELKDEKADLLDAYPLLIDLVADWNKLVIRLVSPTYNKLIDQIPPDSIIHLPGIGKTKVTFLENEISFREYSQLLLTDRYFEVVGSKGNVLFKGYMREEGLADRPANTFANIDDYFKGWVLEKPEEKAELFRPAYLIEDETGDELNEQTKVILKSDGQNAWFSSFHAFECIISRINNAVGERYKADRIRELKKIGRVLPGSLTELRKHLSKLKDTYLTEPQTFIKSPIYLWFLIEKANNVFRHFNAVMEDREEYIRPIPNIKVEKLLASVEQGQVDIESIYRWLNYVKFKMKIEF